MRKKNIGKAMHYRGCQNVQQKSIYEDSKEVKGLRQIHLTRYMSAFMQKPKEDLVDLWYAEDLSDDLQYK